MYFDPIYWIFLSYFLIASYKPDVIRGDMDSIRTEVLEFYAKQVCHSELFQHSDLSLERVQNSIITIW